ncbi:hypothetical protein TNCV_1599161 [Trichonephila clavipes]|nr:hypothetical protein TNCV_1599161 [Trichonephila clavipes]
MLKISCFPTTRPPDVAAGRTSHARQDMWFVHDGVPAHFSIAYSNHLRSTYLGMCIEYSGSVIGPPSSPDLDSLDFFF